MAPKGTRTAILAMLKYVEETSRKWTKYESESSLKFSFLSLLSVSAWSLVVHTWKTTWICVQLGWLPRMAEQKSDPLSPRDKSKIWHQKESPAIQGKKVHSKIRSTLNVYYIGQKVITRDIYSLLFVWLLYLEPSVILYVGTDNIFITETLLYMTYIQYAPRTSIWILMSNSI